MPKKLLLMSAILWISFGFYSKTEFNLVSYNDDLMVDKTEIKNVDWREYMSWLQKNYGNESAVYKNSLPDTTVWNSENGYNKPYVEYYYQHPAYSEYPVVGISYEQAVAYCNWRSNRVNEYIFKQKHKDDTATNYPIVYTFRLPTKQEWLAFASIDMDKKTKKKANKKHPNICKDTNGITICGNFYLKPENISNVLNDNADITSPAKSFYANSIGIYNIFGNVAEMVAEKGIAMGGHYLEKLDNYQPDKEYNYEGPTNWLGFRYVAEKVK